jgi:hypothetical protein
MKVIWLKPVMVGCQIKSEREPENRGKQLTKVAPYQRRTRRQYAEGNWRLLFPHSLIYLDWTYSCCPNSHNKIILNSWITFLWEQKRMAQQSRKISEYTYVHSVHQSISAKPRHCQLCILDTKGQRKSSSQEYFCYPSPHQWPKVKELFLPAESHITVYFYWFCKK